MAVMARVKDYEIAHEYVVQVAMMQDRLFIQFGIEQDAYNQAISYHQLN
jgi:hypothetical protein